MACLRESCKMETSQPSSNYGIFIGHLACQYTIFYNKSVCALHGCIYFATMEVHLGYQQLRLKKLTPNILVTWLYFVDELSFHVAVVRPIFEG